MTESPRSMEPAAAAEVIVRAHTSARALAEPSRPMTVADASVMSGLPLRDAEAGLTWLTSEYRGHLRVTDDGDLVYLFPHGFTKPWETREAMGRLFDTASRVLLGAGRFIVRAWLLIVMIGYALVFLALILGLTLARQGGSDRDQSPAVGALGGLFRMIAEAAFWTFHPFSPLNVGYYAAPYDGYAARAQPRQEKREQDVAFYEKVNRFVFGPETPKEDPHAARAKVLAEIRAQRGRIALADVMRVTGLPRAEADPLMARLMLDHDGDVDVGEGGGIVYRFESLRRTADERPVSRPRAAWEAMKKLPPLTGNTGGANVLVAILNGFNLLASVWAIQHGITLASLGQLFDRHRIFLPGEGTPIVLGVIPLVFSLALFALPAARALHRLKAQKKIDEEAARLGVLREVLTSAARKEPVDDEKLKTVVRVATGEEPTSKDITRRVVELGGDVDTGPSGEIRYRFAELEADAEAAEEERAQAAESEARLGRIVYATDE